MRKGTVIGLLSGIAGGAAVTALAFGKKGNSVNDFDKVKKFKSYYNMLNQWLMLRNAGKKLETYFIEHGYHNIAIYGMGEIGERFYEEMRCSQSVNISYAIDKNANHVLTDMKVYSMEDKFPSVDVIVVTSIFAYDEAKKALEENTDSFVISLEDIIQDLL